MTFYIRLGELIAGGLLLLGSFQSIRDWWWYARPYNFFEFRLGFGLVLLYSGVCCILGAFL